MTEPSADVPVIGGFHPDPSVVRAGDGRYYLATSTFEYLPGIPIHASDDLRTWELVGHVVTSRDQFALDVPTGGGVWAPTIRWHDGVFHVIVTEAYGAGTVVFTAEDASGPWSAGTPVAIDGIDPDLAWDHDGTCFVTYSALGLTTGHRGIEQVRVDLATGELLEAPRTMWSGTGLVFPEAPHLYRIGAWWYLLLAEGGTERGHAISIARGPAPTGPFESCPANPLLTASGTDNPAQCTGHGDLVQAPDGSWQLYLLGVWVGGHTRQFGVIGRETFATGVTWADGWPAIARVDARDRTPLAAFRDVFDDPVLGPEWMAVRRHPGAVAEVHDGLVLRGEGRTMDHTVPTFVGRRQTRLHPRISAVVRATEDGTVGGLSLRFDEANHYDLEVQPGRIVARAVLPTIRQEHELAVPAEQLEAGVELAFEMRRPGAGFPQAFSPDLIDLVAVVARERHVITTLDGRYLSTEAACSFAGRVVGAFCQTGELVVERFDEDDLEPDVHGRMGS